MIKIFIAYSRSDRLLKDEMIAHFDPLRRKWGIEIWHDEEIKAGEQWDASIKKKIREAEIVVTLISSDFLFSKYIQEVEIQEALRRHSNNECLVIPVIARPCAWSADPSLQKIQALPTDGKAVVSWTNKDEAWENVVSSVERILQSIKFDREQKTLIESLKEEIKGLETEKTSLQEELNRAAEQRSKYSALEAKLKETEKVNQLLMEEKNAEKPKSAALESKLEKIEKEKDALKSHINYLEGEIEASQKKN